MRVSGLATGMDTESIIRDLMAANRIPLDKITQKKQYLEWQLDDYRGINRNLLDMQYSLRDTVNRQTTFIAKTVSVSNSDAVNIKALSATSDFSGTISVEKLAKNATMQSKGSVIASEADLTKPLKELKPTLTVPSTITIKAIQPDGKFDVNKPAGTNPVTEAYTAGYEVKLNANSTLKSVLDDINTNSDVTAFYDSATGKIAFTAKNSGQVDGGNEIEFSGNYGFLKIDQNNTLAASTTDTNGDPKTTSGAKGENAVFIFNGLETHRASNTFQINGFEINLKQVTTAESGPVTFSSAADVDKILESVVKFVDDYNKMIEELNAKIREPKHRTFQPLSTEQKADMKEKEIELWEEKAMSGTLRNDPTITSMLSKLRGIMNSSIVGSDGSKISLSDFGITQSKDYLEHGKLEINEDALRKAIADDPNKLYELIGKPNDTRANAGLSVQFRLVVEESRKVISSRAGSAGSVNDTFTLGRNLKDMDKQIERFEDRLKMTENRLWKQFTAMETAIQRMNAQSASLMSQFGGGM